MAHLNCAQNFLSCLDNPRTSQWASPTLLVRIIAEQEPTNISNIFQGSLKSCTLQPTRYPLRFEPAAMNTVTDT